MASDNGVPPFSFVDADGKLEEPQRLEKLRNTGLLTARDRPALDVITRLAAEMTGAAAAVSLVEVDRQVLPSTHGMEEQGKPRETPISLSFCQYVVMNDAPLVVGDARTHPVLSSHPAVLERAVVAYAGFPVHASDGEVLGALCVVDVVPRTWTPAHLAGLKDLATAVDTKIALRLSRRERHLDHERLMHVLDGAAHTLIVTADAEGIVRTMNRAAEDALGPEIDHVGATTLSDLARSGRPWDPEGGLDHAQDWTLVQPHGELRIFSVRVSALHDPEGAVDGYIVIGDDVSARRKSEDLLRDSMRKQGEAVRRLEALDAERSLFITTVGHELRTPVTSILGYTELLDDGECGDLTPAQRDVVSHVLRSGLRLEHLIDDILRLDRIDFTHAELLRSEVDVHRLAKQTWDSIQVHLAGRDLRMTMDVPADLPPVSGDAVDLERVLFNLLINAVKFTPDGGAVRLSVRAVPEGISFDVSDSGVGISAGDQEAVFEPFFRTHEAHTNAAQGAGIGLAVVRRIIESHGGEIALTSAVGQGTTVRFTIPTPDPDQSGGQTKVA